MAVPNDDNYELKPNIAYIYIYDDGKIYNLLNNYQSVAINGHIESHFSQRVNANVISLIKENNIT